jgi:hypothetical protein
MPCNRRKAGALELEWKKSEKEILRENEKKAKVGLGELLESPGFRNG